MQPVLSEMQATKDGHFILEIKLNAPKSLNALTLEMVTQLTQLLEKAKSDPQVVAVVLDSVSDKAFCAGGDVVGIVEAANAGNLKLAEAFFANEYSLDFSIHNFPKPIVCIANGIVLGGGMGLMNGCSHRVVTETTYLAMPEVSIGLFPDVGGGWFLNRLVPGYGLFLGLTAAPLNAADTLYLELADFMICSEYRSRIIENLKSAVWLGDPCNVVDTTLKLLCQRSAVQLEQIEPNLLKHKELIESIALDDPLITTIQKIASQKTNDKWMCKIQSNLAYASPFSMCLIQQQLQQAREMSLKQVFDFEFQLALKCCEYGEFSEGVRALLIDKDRKPKWRYDSIEEVELLDLEHFLASPSSDNGKALWSSTK